VAIGTSLAGGLTVRACGPRGKRRSHRPRQAHGGRLNLANRPGGGALVTVWLP